jgi:hypothetical protein
MLLYLWVRKKRAPQHRHDREQRVEIAGARTEAGLAKILATGAIEEVHFS